MVRTPHPTNQQEITQIKWWMRSAYPPYQLKIRVNNLTLNNYLARVSTKGKVKNAKKVSTEMIEPINLALPPIC